MIIAIVLVLYASMFISFSILTDSKMKTNKSWVVYWFVFIHLVWGFCSIILYREVMGT